MKNQNFQIRLEGALNFAPQQWGKFFNTALISDLQQIINLPSLPPEKGPASLWPSKSDKVEVMLTGPGALKINHEVLQAFPKLRLIVHASGSVKPFMTPELANSGIRISSATSANARPVAEFCLGILLGALKQTYQSRQLFAQYGPACWWQLHASAPHSYKDTCIGLVGYGAITRQLLELLKIFDFEVFVASSYFSDEDAHRFQAKAASLEWILQNCAAISLHSADVPKNLHLINRSNLALLKENAVLINTARGNIINEVELFHFLRERSDVYAFLDVLTKEPPDNQNPLFTLPNCIVTPHLAGAIGNEKLRLGRFAIDEISRFLYGQNLLGEIDVSRLKYTA